MGVTSEKRSLKRAADRLRADMLTIKDCVHGGESLTSDNLLQLMRSLDNFFFDLENPDFNLGDR